MYSSKSSFGSSRCAYQVSNASSRHRGSVAGPCVRTAGFEPCTTGRPWLLISPKNLNMLPEWPLASIFIGVVYVSQPGDVGLDGW